MKKIQRVTCIGGTSITFRRDSEWDEQRVLWCEEGAEIPYDEWRDQFDSFKLVLDGHGTLIAVRFMCEDRELYRFDLSHQVSISTATGCTLMINQK